MVSELVFEDRRWCAVLNGLLHVLGVDDVSGRWYGFWSGVGGDLALLATPVTLLRKHNCHTKRCWRIGRHPVEGTTWTVCRRHHPDDHPSAVDVANAASPAAATHQPAQPAEGASR
jgi:hypothetical protein